MESCCILIQYTNSTVEEAIYSYPCLWSCSSLSSLVLPFFLLLHICVATIHVFRNCPTLSRSYPNHISHRVDKDLNKIKCQVSPSLSLSLSLY